MIIKFNGMQYQYDVSDEYLMDLLETGTALTQVGVDAAQARMDADDAQILDLLANGGEAWANG